MNIKKHERIYAIQILLSLVFVALFYYSAYLVFMVWDLLEDDIFFYNHFLVGFYQWLYTLPLILFLRRKKQLYGGFVIGGILLTLLNIAFIVWVFLDPSFFF